MTKFAKTHVSALFLVTLCLIIACSKDAQVNTSNEQGTIQVQGKEGNIDLKLNQFSDQEIIEDKLYPENEVIYTEMHRFTNVLKDFVTNQDITKFIFESAAVSESGAVPIKAILEKFPIVAEKWKTTLSLNGNNGRFEHRGNTYEIGISVPNVEKANNKLNPIVGTGIDLYDDLANNNPDLIFAYYTNNNGNQHLVNIGEKEAFKVNNPVFVSVPLLIGNPVVGQLKGIDDDKPNIKNELQARVERTFVDNYIIYSRYDKSPSTEFQMVSAKPFTTSTSDLNVEEIFGDLVGSRSYPNTTLRDALIEDLIFNTYERDWYASRSNLGTTNSSGNQMKGRRSFFDEWYSFEPSAVGPNDASIRFYPYQLNNSGSQSFNFTGSKGDWVIKFTR